MRLKKGELIYQFKITLLHTEPSIWRRIQVPSGYSFWDLHVAIQDAMGWTDSHLHMFRMHPPGKQKEINIGIPDNEFDDIEIVAGWHTPLERCFWRPGTRAIYEYDFGDSWEHDLLFEGVLIQEAGFSYPRCLAGENACPPEDCGGVNGYHDLLRTVQDSSQKEHESMVVWLASMVPDNIPFDPTRFDAKKVRFDNPKRRLRNLHMQ